MSITKSFNKHTNTWYAYETTYVFDEALGRKVQKRKCIGKFDPATGEILQNGSRGRKRLDPEAAAANAAAREKEKLDRQLVLKKLSSFEKILDSLQSEIRDLKAQLSAPPSSSSGNDEDHQA